jgi:hypothetical protein
MGFPIFDDPFYSGHLLKHNAFQPLGSLEPQNNMQSSALEQNLQRVRRPDCPHCNLVEPRALVDGKETAEYASVQASALTSSVLASRPGEAVFTQANPAGLSALGSRTWTPLKFYEDNRSFV